MVAVRFRALYYSPEKQKVIEFLALKELVSYDEVESIIQKVYRECPQCFYVSHQIVNNNVTLPT